MQIKYVFRDEPLTITGGKKANPQRIGEAFAKIAKENKGHLTTKKVVDAARDPKSVLHKHFEWDDSAAAQKWRETQAGDLIRIIHIADGEMESPPRAFLSVPDKGRVSYRTLGEIQTSTTLQLAILKQAERELEGFEKRYHDLTEICDLVRTARGIAKKKIAEARPSA